MGESLEQFQSLKTWVSCHSRAGGNLSIIHTYPEFPHHLTPEAILQPHDTATWARIAEEFVALIVQGTTKQDLSKHMAVTSGRRPSCSDTPGYSEAAARVMPTIDD